MRRGSTPTNTFRTNVDLTGAVVYVTYAQGDQIVLEKTGGELTIDGSTVSTTLTQEETLAFTPGTVKVQLRYRLPDGTADASDILQLKASEILKDGVI